MFPFLNLGGWNVFTVRPHSSMWLRLLRSRIGGVGFFLKTTEKGLRSKLSCVLNIRLTSPQIPSAPWSENTAQYYE